jgi:hypothetical protein
MKDKKAGRPSKFSEPSEGINIKVPKSKKEEIKVKFYKILEEYK